MSEVLYVNGYGATQNLDDGNYTRYLGEIIRHINWQPQRQFTVYLCGGHTNRTDLTEAACMRNIWEHLGAPPNAALVLIENTTTARDNLKEVGRHTADLHVTVFCEFSRMLTMEFLASRFFSRSTVFGIPFDTASLLTANMLKQRGPKLFLEVLANYLPLFDHLRLALRKRHVAKARHKTT